MEETGGCDHAGEQASHHVHSKKGIEITDRAVGKDQAYIKSD